MASPHVAGSVALLWSARPGLVRDIPRTKWLLTRSANPAVTVPNNSTGCGGIASVRDLKGKTIVYAQNSPSQYFINNLLLNAGLQPSQVNHKYTATAFEAAAAGRPARGP